MTTPPCYGAEFSTNADHCLTTVNVPTRAWPYSPSTCAQGSNNALRRDPDLGLWARPRTPHLWNFNSRNTTPSQINTAGWVSWSWQTPVTAAADACRSEQLVITSTFTATVELYLDTWVTLAAWTGQATPVPAETSFETLDTRFFWDETPVMKATVTGLVTKRISLTTSTPVQVGLGLGLLMQQRAGSTPTWGRVLDTSIDSVGWIFPNPSPASDG